MTVRYVGPGGSDSNDGLSWANRKLTLNGVEDSPVAAGDVIYVGPGVYREVLNLDVAGSSGNPITYIGDITGENTDGVGGVVRITGSDNDQTATRSNCITLPNARSFRTFRGFLLDTPTSSHVLLNPSSSSVIFEDCAFQPNGSSAAALFISGSGTGNIVRRCIFIVPGPAVQMFHTATVSDSGFIVENCLVISNAAQACVRIDRVGGGTVRNCTLFGGNNGVRVLTALAGGQTTTVNNCIIFHTSTALVATTTGEITEDYNCLFANNTNYSNVSAGASTVTYPPLFEPNLLVAGYRLPWRPFNPGEWSLVAHRTGSSPPTDDLYGIPRPATNSKTSWGAIQDITTLRETTTVRTGATSLQMPDAGRVQILVPVTNVATTISVYVQRQADYAGTLPQMVIKQPGQADRTTTDTGAASAWNELTDTFTPSAGTDFVIVELVSNNTATSGSYAALWDDLEVT